MAEISTANGNLTDLSPEEEKQVISGFARKGEAEAKEGDTFFLLSLRWWRIWSAFVNQSPTITTNDGSSMEYQGSGRRPPSIDNSDLICESSSEDSTPEIYDTLVEGTDYILVPEEIWNQLYAWYGGGPALARKVITRGSSQTELTVEVYPLRLQLHFVPRVDHYPLKMSRKETIGALHKKACQIFHLIPYQVRIWDYYGRCKHALLNDLDATLDDANIQMDQDILVEVIGHNGRCKTVVQGNGCAYIDNGVSKSKTCKSNLCLTNKAGTIKGGSCVGLIGLLNLGNTCFMNTAIQCLVHTPQFARYFLGDFHQEINRENPIGMQGELALAFGELVRKLWAAGRAVFAPRVFKAKLARFAPQFAGNNQHDSQELLAFLLDGLHEDLNRVKKKPYNKSKDADGRPDEQIADEYWANHISRNDSIIVDVCQGQYRSTLICPTCEKMSVTFDPFMYLSLPIHSESAVSIYSCIEGFLGEEPLVPEDMWFCPRCKERRPATKKLDLWRLPEVLVIHLKRFSYSRTMKIKLETYVDFPLHDFDLSTYVANNKNSHGSPQVYQLYALANHYGNMGAGHYTAHVKLINQNRWYRFDDSHVSGIIEDDVKSNAAYVLFYRRMKTDTNGTHSFALHK
ncbi:ubiquitin carboxyl-terminal hydrolase 5 isoform X1 [Lactuca sativa]|uniref:ubiquitin carboxyl-terminal hydrolase 5 isoform X1 n=1 Tax=Lactuca sativa TaxID=4236 RepID=UPI001C68B67A|nr:ubiquitin carboxyl-terminal hydrolase 5 isoform X1 [Lactuca sativa]